MKQVFKKKIEKINNLFNGIIEKNDFFSPTYINIENPKYIEIDNIFYKIFTTNDSRRSGSIKYKHIRRSKKKWCNI